MQRRLGIIALFALSASGCAREGSEAVSRELRALDAQAAEGVAKIHRALRDPALTSSELGEGVRLVDLASRRFVDLEHDERASDVQQLLAIVHQARAWDDVATTFASTPPLPGLEATQQAVLSSVLAEKAAPARTQAAQGYRRALETACKSGLDHLPVFAEILDGAARYGGDERSLERPCGD